VTRCVYLLWDQQDTLLYVGSSDEPRQRLQSHFGVESPFTPYVHHMTTIWFAEPAAANHWEYLTHVTERPVFCRPGPGTQARELRERSKKDWAQYIATATPIVDNSPRKVTGGTSPHDGLNMSLVPTKVATRALGVAPGELGRLLQLGFLKPCFWNCDGTPEWDLVRLRQDLEWRKCV
jgi:hypothetical protein